MYVLYGITHNPYWIFIASFVSFQGSILDFDYIYVQEV